MIRTKSNCSWFLYLIALGSLLSLNLTVAAQTVYTIGGIPPQEILQGSALSFTLQSAGPGTGFSYSLDPGYPAPQGSIALDASTGAFAYTPSGSDKFEFRLTFTASMDGQPSESQSVLITPIAMVPPEGDIIAVVQQSAAVPDEASSDYVVVTQSQNAGPELFNTVQQTTINVEISGKTVIFDQNDQVHNLFTSFSGRPDMKNMSVYAETLIIRSPLKLPGTNLTVYARHLRFEDQTGQPPASIDTTPQPYLAAAAQLQNGNAGQAAGNVQLIIGDVYSDPGTNVRIVANGGKAQDAGQGAAGAPKPDYVPPNKGRFFNISQKDQHGEISWPYGNNPNGLVLAADGSLLQPPYPIVVSVTSDRCHELVMGQPPMWPEDGSDAIPPGTPGTGGSGGQVSATLQLTSLIQFVGGASGRPGLPQSGGPPQNPVFSGWFKTVNGRDCLNDHFDAEVVALHTSVAGKDAPSIPPAQPQGPDGAFTLIAESTQNRWLHPYWIRQVLAHVKDTYRGGNMQYATNVLQDYSNLLGSYQSSSGSIR